MTCKVDSSLPYTVHWYRNDEPLADGGRIRIQHGGDGELVSLTIKLTLPADKGVFKCVATSKAGRAVTKARLLIGSTW